MGVAEEITGVGKPKTSLDLSSRNAPIMVSCKRGTLVDCTIFLFLDSVEEKGFAVLVFHKKVRNMRTELSFELQWQAEPSDNSGIDV